MSAPTLTLRAATHDDLPTIVDLWCDLNQQHEAFDDSWKVAPGGRKRFLAGLGLSLTSPLVVLQVAVNESDEVVGYCHGIVKMQPEFWVEQRVGIIVSICVASEARSTGIGARLLEDATEWFRGQGIIRVETLVSSANTAGLRFWDRAGFEPHSSVLSRRLD